MDNETFVRVIRARLLTVMHEDDFDVVAGEDGALDISTDHWTIHLEHDVGFLAIDDEPEQPSQFATSRRAVISERVERALAFADGELDGALSAALTASSDPFTLDFVAALSKHQADDSPE
jgi:hypothetical protein